MQFVCQAPRGCSKGGMMADKALVITVPQAWKYKAVHELLDQGIQIELQGWTDGSTTWTLLVYTDREPKSVQQLLWDIGVGSVQVRPATAEEVK